jgi:hypothetical protein
VRANEDDQQATESGPAQARTGAALELAGREPYTPPVIEKFPPMGNVTFGTSVQPMLAMSLAGA